MSSGPQGPGITPEARAHRARAWLRYAAHDLSAARLLLRHLGAEAAPYHAAFWAQQGAEKALKGALTFAGVPFGDTHRLNALAALLPTEWQTRRTMTTLGELTRYGVETRYPDLGEAEPTSDDARRAVEQALAVQRAVRSDLETHGFLPRSSRRQAAPRRAMGGEQSPGSATEAAGEEAHRVDR